MTPIQEAVLAPVSVAAVAVAVRTALRCATLLIALVITARGASPESRMKAFGVLAAALSPARAAPDRRRRPRTEGR